MIRSGPALRLLLVTVGVVAACDPATDPLSYEDFVKADGEGEFGLWVHAGLYNRTYFLPPPPEMEEGRRYPLLIFLHGGGDSGERFARRIRAGPVTDAAGFITVYPDGLQGSWTVGCPECTQAAALAADDINFLQVLVRHLAEHLPVDTTQVFLAGYSQGGSLAHFYACASSIPPAGVVGVASLVYRNVAAACEPAGSFPVSIVHGTADGLAYYLGFGLEAPFLSVPEAVDLWVDQLGCDAEPSITETPDQAQDFTSITTFRFGNCLGGHPVVHQRVNGGGHTWPGSVGPWGILAGRTSHNLDLTTEIVNLFRAVVDGG